MNYEIYIQSLNGFPFDDWAVSAYLGFRDRQANIFFFENIEEVPVRKNVILVASIENTNAFFQKLGLPPKQAINIPSCLMKYAQRTIEYMTIGEFLKTDKFPIFVKPNGKSKEFVAGVVSNAKHLTFFHDLPLETKAMTSEVVNIISEYRCYVIEGELKGIKHYAGDFTIFPDVDIIKHAILDYKDAPSGYAIDFGIEYNKKHNYYDTILIEVNDGFSIGNYGLENSIYVTLLCKRWLEIMRTI